MTPGGSVPTAKGVIPEQDKFHAARESSDVVAPSDEATNSCQHQHDAGCAMLDEESLQASWWEEFPCDNAAEVFGQPPVNCACLVVPPSNQAASMPAPVILFLGGDGHVDDKQDFLWGGVDLLIRNPKLREHCFIVAPKPTSSSGLLRCNDNWKRTWAEDAVWAVLTEVLRRLGPYRADPSRIYATGLSLGAIGVWNLATRYGHHFAAIAPIAGSCEWPGGCWQHGSKIDDVVHERLKALPIRAYQIDVDPNSGHQKDDIDGLIGDLVPKERDLVLPGMEKDKTCSVHVHEWCRTCGGASWELWTAQGPLNDWSAWDEWGGDKHFLWQRAYPLPEWGLADFFLSHSVPEWRCWRFDSPSSIVDIRTKILEWTMSATKEVAGVMTKPWQDQVQEFTQKFFDCLCCACGDRPWLEKFDFAPTLLYGIRANLVQLLPFAHLLEFEAGVRKATCVSLDKVRYQLRSFQVIRNAVQGKRSQVQVREAVDRAREEVVKEMLEMKADEFVKTWIANVAKKLEKEDSLQALPRMSALKLFREMVTEGGGIPIPMMPEMLGVSLEDWAPLTRTVNRLFDDPEPPKKKAWKDWPSDPEPAKKDWNAPSSNSGNSWSAPASKDWGNSGNSWNAPAAKGAWGSGDSWPNQNAMAQMLKAAGGGGSWGASSWNSGRSWGPY